MSSRIQLAVALLPATLLVPVLSSAFGGLTHPAACRASVSDPVTVNRSSSQTEVATSAAVLERSNDSVTNCEGYDLLLQARSRPDGRVRIILPVVNSSATAATATVDLRVGNRRFPVVIGRVPSGGSRAKTVNVVVPDGDTDISGALIVSP